MVDSDLTILDILGLAPVVPVLTIDDADLAVPLAEALVGGGLLALEVTLRTDAALASIRAISERVANAVVGAGTITEPEQFKAALDAGARFAVSPGSTRTLIDAARDVALPYLPAAATVSEVMALLELGLNPLKFFPAEPAGGIPALKALYAPIPEARFCPTGGIGAANAPAYLALPNVVCVGGSWVAPNDAIAARDWPRITALAAEASRLGRH